MNPETDAGIGLLDVTNCTVQNNSINTCASGIALLGSDNNTISDNIINNNMVYGIVLDYYLVNTNVSTYNMVSGNVITNSGGDGIYAGLDSNYNTYTDNNISGTTGLITDGDGIYLWKSANNTVTGNTISDNAQYGLELMGSQNNTITGNIITGNAVNGIRMRASTGTGEPRPNGGNQIHNNKIYSNTGLELYAEDNYDAENPIDATSNWWGTADYSTIITEVGGNVNYNPWYITTDLNVLNTAGDLTAPMLQNVTPAKGTTVSLGDSGTFILTVDASDVNGLCELEIDNSMESIIPQFSVYANTGNPYGSAADKTQFEAVGANVTYDATLQKWTIDLELQ
jgi:parallel beta-helix repeat protein